MIAIDWRSETLWAAVAAVAALLGILGPLFAWFASSVRRSITSAVQPLREENARLRADMDTRLRLPSFTLDAVRLTEMAAERRVEQLQLEHGAAVEAKDRELASTLTEQMSQIQDLRNQLDAASAERNRLSSSLRSKIDERMASDPPHAATFLTGPIVVMRRQGKYAAVQAIDQASQARGAFIKYAWWYNPDGGSRFTSANVLHGFAIAGEQDPHRPPTLEIGPLRVPWSIGGDGQGWLYFHRGAIPPDGCELSLTDEIDISKVDGSKLQFRPPAADGSGRRTA